MNGNGMKMVDFQLQWFITDDFQYRLFYFIFEIENPSFHYRKKSIADY